jgi:hypothetical protein
MGSFVNFTNLDIDSEFPVFCFHDYLYITGDCPNIPNANLRLKKIFNPG